MATDKASVTRVLLSVAPLIGPANENDALEIDCTVRQEHNIEVEVTQHPVEVGADPADHARIKPRTLVLEGIQSATPLHLPLPSPVTQGPGQEGRRDGVPSGGWDVGLNERIKQADAYFLRAIGQSRLLQVTTAVRAYSNMLITSYKVNRDKSTGDALSFNLSLLEVRIVSNLIVPTVNLRRAKVDLGKKPGAPVTPPPKDQSYLDKLISGKR